MQLIGLAAWGYAAVCAIWGVRTGQIREKTVRFAALALLVGSMSVTCTLVFISGLDPLRTILPLHLCSASAVLCLFFYIKPARSVFHWLYYVGLPGAALALCFPAVAVSRYQNAMDACFFLTHALVVFAPMLHIACGERPDHRAAMPCYICLLLFAAVTYTINRLIDANYLFLMAPPSGTPLTLLWQMGEGAYYASLATLALCIVLAQRKIAAYLERRNNKKAPFIQGSLKK